VLTGLMAVAVMLTSCVACTSDPPVATIGTGVVSKASPTAQMAGPWPAGLTPELQAAAVAALAAFDNYTRIVVATHQDPIGIGGDPSQPWEPEIRRYLADPAADSMITATESLANGPIHLVGPATFEGARVSAITSRAATVVVCIDIETVTAAGDGNEPVAVPVISTPRRVATFGLRPFIEKGWLVSDERVSEPPVPC
jgi:hypothetical protein